MLSLNDFQSLLAGYARRHPFPDDPPMLYEPCTYMLSLRSKRLRPVLTLMACELFIDEVERALPAAWAVELFHNFTLIHDDIMDAAPLRRGQPTVHTRWNVNTGILSGDVMLIFAYKHLLKVHNDRIAVQLVNIFNRVAIQVCEGQQRDLDFEQRDEVSLSEYLYMIEQKTAVLLGGALEMGACCAGASAVDGMHLYYFGLQAGTAFQIQDDWLDAYGDPERVGKQVGGDILQNKKTFLTLKTLELADEADRAALREWLRTPADTPGKVEAVRALFDRYDISAHVAEAKAKLQRSAYEHLDAVKVPLDRQTLLRQTVEQLLERDH
ncbi:MAG: polyprenyl synthetase family protein [Saprospiraceae bacterium]|nr:polyprenyl synthetase family protein [Saprospiraceae bacterium]MDW8230951.1 polyprenyl synthetase family protein [Saprospiraceae bacterium]